MKNTERTPKKVAETDSSAQINAHPHDLDDWRAVMLARVRGIVMQADPGIVEEVKWRKPSNPAGVPVWSRDGIVCTGETYKSVVKLTFARGAELEDPAGLFNASLDGNVRRAIDIREGDKVDEKALKDLVRAAVALNGRQKDEGRGMKAEGRRMKAEGKAGE